MKTIDILNNAHVELTTNGWEFVCTVMAKKTETKNYGKQYVKGGITFFLNTETMHFLPNY
ncbi:MAG: hypothetical protein ACK6DA_01155 [Candidatus Kapaibacterium sp.]